MTFRPYSKNKSLGIPEGETMTSKEYKEALKDRGRKNKHNAKKSTYNGYTYDSGLEADYAKYLDFLKEAGYVKKWVRQFKISIDINDVHIANYFIDFKIWFDDGRTEMHEVKGPETDLWRIKWRLSKALHPDWNFVLIKKVPKIF